MGTYEGIHYQHFASDVVVCTTGDDVPGLSLSAASSDLNGCQVCSEISRELINRETFAVCSL